MKKLNREYNLVTNWLYSFIFMYNEQKYWKCREKCISQEIKLPLFIKALLLIYCKHSEARNACSLGTAINAGAVFKEPPYLPHGITGIFISHAAVIGKNCTILQNVTIGSSKGKAPVIGDNCVIGAGAMIIGDVKVGDNVVIGANTTVVKDVPDNTTVVNMPARYIPREEARDFRF